jgi:hypothetical protein
MSLRAYLTLMAFGTIVAAATFFLVLFRVDPAAAGVLGFALFYLSLFFVICGLISIFAFLARVALHREEMLSRLVGLSFRQAVLFSLLIVGALALHAYKLLSWWNSLLLVAAVTVVEFIFISLEKRPTGTDRVA